MLHPFGIHVASLLHPCCIHAASMLHLCCIAQGTCFDASAECSIWAQLGQCSGATAEHMQENCGKSCGYCGRRRQNKCILKLIRFSDSSCSAISDGYAPGEITQLDTCIPSLLFTVTEVPSLYVKIHRVSGLGAKIEFKYYNDSACMLTNKDIYNGKLTLRERQCNTKSTEGSTKFSKLKAPAPYPKMRYPHSIMPVACTYTKAPKKGSATPPAPNSSGTSTSAGSATVSSSALPSYQCRQCNDCPTQVPSPPPTAAPTSSCPTAVSGFNCTGHGECVKASRIMAPSTVDNIVYKCVCESGWMGALCNLAEPQCPSAQVGTECSGHGSCNKKTNPAQPFCVCELGWAGSACEREIVPTPTPQVGERRHVCCHAVHG